jgi:hypothetical protein
MIGITSKERTNLIKAWVEENNPKSYKHGQRPEGEKTPGDISVWARKKKKSSEEDPIDVLTSEWDNV